MARALLNILLRCLVRLRLREGSTPLDPASVTSVLVIELTRLGDVAAVLPSLQAIRNRFPHAALAVALQEKHAGLLELLPWIGSRIGCKRPATLAGLLDLRARLRKGKFDLIISASPSFRNALLTLVLPSPFKLGYLSLSDARTPFFGTHPVRAHGFRPPSLPAFHMQSIGRRARLLSEAAGAGGEAPVQWRFPEPLLETLERLLDRPGFAGRGPLAVIHPFAGWKYREWPLERVMDTASFLIISHSARIVFVGERREFDAAPELAGFCETRPAAVLLASPPVALLAALLHRADLFLGNDSGPLHVASALDTPGIGLFGPAPPSLTGPVSPRSSALYGKVECSPCRQITCIRPHRTCMEEISTEDVRTAAEKMLRRSRVPAGA